MKFVDVRVLPLDGDVTPFLGQRGADDGQMHVLLKVLTDEGVTDKAAHM